MLLNHLFESLNKKHNPILTEGGNVSSKSPGWQGAADQEAEEIDLKIHDRDFMVGQLRTLLTAQNESFKKAYGKYIWEPQLLKSGKMFSGSSLQFFDVEGINTQDFLNKLKKQKVGDIDTQIDQDMGEEVTTWLKSVIGKKVGNATMLGFNSSLSSIWKLDDPPVRVQVDYELGPYDPETKAPTEWFAYSHSSHYDDMAAGIKGVFHKYINRALTHAQSSTKYVARVLKKGVKISDEPVTDSDYSFAVTSAQGGGMSKKYKPYIDPATGKPMEKDGIPVMQQLDPKDRDYIQNLDQQFQINYGRKRTKADQALQGSFVGTLKLMNKSFTPDQNEAVARAFLDILFGPGAQMITKDDPARDRDTKFAAVDAMLLGGSGIEPLNLPNGKAMRQQAVQMAMDYADKFNAKKAGKASESINEVAEDPIAEADSKPNYARQGIKHLYNRLPDGRVSTTEMKDAEFQEVAKEIAANGGTLNGFPVNLKVDGAGIRFGKDESGRPFFMTSKVTTPLYQDDVGYFTSFGQQKGQDEEQLARTKKYDEALALITGSKFIQALPPDTIVQAEMLYNPMAEKTDQGLKFVNISYDPKKLGKKMTLVPFMIKQFSTGEERPDADKIKKKLLSAGDSNIKMISNSLEQKGINVSKIINPILNLDPKDKANKPAFDKAKQELSAAIIDNPKLAGKDALGNNMEGIVVNMPNGQLFKVTSPEMKNIMASKLAQPGAKKEGPLKTAVVAIGSFVGHIGHEQLWDYTVKKAAELGGDPYLFIGNAVGADDPIPPEVKTQTWHKMYPEYKNNISAMSEEGGSLMQKIKHELINPKPGKPPRYDNIVIMVGEDQSKMPIANALMKAVNKFPGYEHVKVTLNPTPRGTGMSFTKLRNILKDPKATPEEQYAVWAQGFNEKKLGKDWILHLMDISRKGMNIAPRHTSPSGAKTNMSPKDDDYAINYGPKGLAKLQNQSTIENVNLPLSWSGLGDHLTIEEKTFIFEEFYVNSNLTENVDKNDITYFTSLFTLSDTLIPKKKYIVAPILLIDGRAIALDRPDYLEFVSQTGRIITFNSPTGIKTYPSEELRDISIFHTFTFSSEEKYNKFRTALNMKFNTNLPKVTLPENEGIGGAIAGGLAGGIITKTPGGVATGAEVGSNIQDYFTKKEGVDPGMAKLFSWKAEVLQAYPNLAKQIKFLSKPDSTISAEIPGQDRSYGVFDLSTEEGEVLGENSSFSYPSNPEAVAKMLASRNRPASSSTDDVKTFMSQGYTIKFKPDALEIYYGPNLVYSKSGNYSNPTRAHLGLARSRVTDLVNRKKKVKEASKQRLDPKCWKGYRKSGTKMKGGVRVNNCVKIGEGWEQVLSEAVNRLGKRQ